MEATEYSTDAFKVEAEFFFNVINNVPYKNTLVEDF